MEENFTVMIKVAQPPSTVFGRLRDVSKWWGGADLAGRAVEVGDEFTVIHGDAHYSKQRVMEVVPNSRIVWLVTESKMTWLEVDKSEWKGTRMIFEITAEGKSTKLQFTHEGLTHRKESYVRCAEGWTMVITEWLFDFITKNKSHL